MATTAPSVAGSIEELLDHGGPREDVKTADSLSGSSFERVEVGGRPCLVKYLCVDDDWLLRATGDLGIRQVELWRRGFFDRLPGCIDPALLGVAAWTRENGRACAALLMRDVGAELVTPGDAVVALALHRRFLDHMARFHAALTGERDLDDIFPLSNHYLFLSPDVAALEIARGTLGVPPELAAGWSRLDRAAPRVAGLLRELAGDPSPLVDALAATPQTVVHGDWKFGNLGATGEDVTILLDWDRCGRGPATVDLAWYLAVNCDRLPESKEDAIAHYRQRLEIHGIDTDGWWETQLRLALLGGALQLGWAKTNGNLDELGWWEARALDAVPLLG